jgi:inhibitor of cysteine peptidase
MHWKITALAMTPLVLFGVACSAQPSRSVVVEMTCERFTAETGDQVKITRQVSIGQGGQVVLRICTNPSTGFEWEDAVVSTPSVLEQRSRAFMPPGVTMPGSAGLEQWTFEAVGTGVCVVALSYSQPWELGEKGVWLFELEVTVR